MTTQTIVSAPVNPFASLAASKPMQDQILAGQTRLEFAMVVGRVKMFRTDAEPKKRYGFITIYNPEISTQADGLVDVFVHSMGLYEWCDDGGETPGIRRTEYLPSKNKIVFLDDVRQTVDPQTGETRYRADRCILATVSSFQRVVNEIQNRSVYRLIEVSADGTDVLWEGRDLIALSHRFPAEGRISYPLEASEKFARYFVRLEGTEWVPVAAEDGDTLLDIRV